MDDVTDRAKAGGKPPAQAGYEMDTYSWAFEQAALLREGRWSELDIENLADEIESVGKSERDKLESALRVVLLHLLKWDHQPDERTRSWAVSIETHRDQFRFVLDENRGLDRQLPRLVVRAYRLARLEASGETELDLSVFPEACPWSLDEILSRPVDWPPA